MTFDLFATIQWIVFFFVLGVIVGGVIVHAVLTNDQATLSWIHYHLPWLYPWLSSTFTCPVGYVCMKP